MASMKSLRWKLNQTYTKSTPSTFMNNLKHRPATKANPWVGDAILYVLLLGAVVACVYILIKMGKDVSSL